MGAVTLLVGDLDGMTRYYRDVVTLEVLSAEGETVTLGRAGRPIVILRREPSLRHASPGSAGLFHTAILFETQAALAAALYSVARSRAGHLHRIGRPPRQPGVLLHRPRGQRHRALLGPRAHRVVLDARPDRDGDPVPRSERLPRGAPQRRGGRRGDGAGCGIRRSCAPVGGGCRNRPRLLRRRPRLRRDGRTRQPGRVRERRRVPPPHGDERVELPRSRTPDAGARSRPGRSQPARRRRDGRARRAPARPRLRGARRRPHAVASTTPGPTGSWRPLPERDETSVRRCRGR